MSIIKEYSPIEAGLTEIKNKYATVHDITTQKGYEQCKKDAKSVGKYRTKLEALRVEIKAPALERCRDIDGEAKRIQIEIAKVEDPLKLAYKSVDDKKKKQAAERLAKIEEEIELIRVSVSKSLGATSNEISLLIEVVDAIDCTEGFYELTKEALIVRKETLEHLNSALKQTIQSEIAEKTRIAQEAELEELRKVQSEQEEKQRKIDDQQREIDHQKELQEQEKQAKIDADNAEKKRLIDVKQAEEEATQREIERQEDIKTEAAATQRRLEANKKHVGKIRCEIKEHLMELCDLGEKTAKSVVLALLKTNRVTINY